MIFKGRLVLETHFFNISYKKNYIFSCLIRSCCKNIYVPCKKTPVPISLTHYLYRSIVNFMTQIDIFHLPKMSHQILEKTLSTTLKSYTEWFERSSSDRKICMFPLKKKKRLVQPNSSTELNLILWPIDMNKFWNNNCYRCIRTLRDGHVMIVEGYLEVEKMIFKNKFSTKDMYFLRLIQIRCGNIDAPLKKILPVYTGS